MNKALIDQLATLSSDERLELAYGLLDSVIEERDAPALSDAQRRELRTRLEHHRAHPDEPTMTLAEIRKSLGVD
jgi:putative addiction module component (TIGR02574 family)